MKTILKELNKFTKSTIIIGGVILIYGYLTRIIPIYLFWESKTIGWGILSIGIVGLLLSLIKIRKEKKKKTLWHKIGIGVIGFIIFVHTLIIIILPFTDAYSISRNYVKENSEIIKEVGEITGYGFIPKGSISIQSNSKGTTGTANITLIVKGTDKYLIINVIVVKYYDTEWIVSEIYK